MLRYAVLLLSGNALVSVLTLARSLILARLISVADYGIASTLGLVLAIIEMTSAIGLQTRMVQSRDGDDPDFQAALQGFQLIRGLANGLILFALAVPFARFMGIPEAAWGYQLLALVPMLGALGHFDAQRLNRQMKFGPSILIGVLPAVAALLAVWPLWLLLGDWRVMLYLILTQVALGVLLSHLLAQRAYRVAFDRGQMAASLRFGWPILVNGGLMFLVFNGDKMVVGRALGMEVLAIFAMGVTLTLTPTLILSRSISSLMLPRLAQQPRGAPEDEARFRRMASGAVEANLVSAMLLVAATCLLGPWFVAITLGDRYDALASLLVWMAVLQTIRMMKEGPVLIALSQGVTTNPLLSNLVRAASIPVAWLALELGGGLLQVVAIAIAAETIGLAISFLLVRSKVGYPLRPLLPTVLVTALFYAASVAYGAAGELGAALDARPATLQAVAMALMLATALGGALVSTNLSRQLFRFGRAG